MNRGNFFRRGLLALLLIVAGLFLANGIAYADTSDDIQKYTAQIAQNPNDAEAYNNRGVAHAELKQYDKALADFNKAIELEPNYAVAYYNRGFLHLLAGGGVDPAFKDATKAIQINPDFAAAYNLRGMCYQVWGEFKKAQADFDKAKELGYNG